MGSGMMANVLGLHFDCIYVLWLSINQNASNLVLLQEVVHTVNLDALFLHVRTVKLHFQILIERENQSITKDA